MSIEILLATNHNTNCMINAAAWISLLLNSKENYLYENKFKLVYTCSNGIYVYNVVGLGIDIAYLSNLVWCPISSKSSSMSLDEVRLDSAVTCNKC